MQLHKIEDSEGIDLKKTDESKECKVCHYNYFNNGFKSDLKICNECDWGIKSFGNFAIITGDRVGYRFFMFDMTEEDVIEFLKILNPMIEILQFDKTDVSEGIDINKTSASKECMLWHYWYFKVVGYKLEPHLCNVCHNY